MKSVELSKRAFRLSSTFAHVTSATIREMARELEIATRDCWGGNTSLYVGYSKYLLKHGYVPYFVMMQVNSFVQNQILYICSLSYWGDISGEGLQKRDVIACGVVLLIAVTIQVSLILILLMLANAPIVETILILLMLANAPIVETILILLMLANAPIVETILILLMLANAPIVETILILLMLANAPIVETILILLMLANAPIVETKFLELAMSWLDFSLRIPLSTFSILHCTVVLKVPTNVFHL